MHAHIHTYKHTYTHSCIRIHTQHRALWSYRISPAPSNPDAWEKLASTAALPPTLPAKLREKNQKNQKNQGPVHWQKYIKAHFPSCVKIKLNKTECKYYIYLFCASEMFLWRSNQPSPHPILVGNWSAPLCCKDTRPGQLLEHIKAISAIIDTGISPNKETQEKWNKKFWQLKKIERCLMSSKK